MTPAQVRQAEKLLVRLALIKSMRVQTRDATEFRLMICTDKLDSRPEVQVLHLERPEAADLLDQLNIDLRRALEIGRAK